MIDIIIRKGPAMRDSINEHEKTRRINLIKRLIKKASALKPLVSAELPSPFI
ncbi:hypothetical protein [Peribacillus simplex]|uniref:hypothetical protein n=1 Tax=Peribacillus simplex TaxID=1478 RepID=UPI001623593A|nr:hypothetical protein [Peribacillus simplex]